MGDSHKRRAKDYNGWAYDREELLGMPCWSLSGHHQQC